MAFAVASVAGSWALLTCMQRYVEHEEHDWLDPSLWRLVLCTAAAGALAETIPTPVGNLDNMLIPLSTVLVGAPWALHMV